MKLTQNKNRKMRDSVLSVLFMKTSGAYDVSKEFKTIEEGSC
jgi:hypothetical protein